MANRTTIVRNTSGGQLTLVGQRLENEESFHIEQRHILKWRDDLTVSGAVLSGDLTVNNGNADLPTPNTGFNYLFDVKPGPPAIIGNDFVTVTSGDGVILLSTDNAGIRANVKATLPAVVASGSITVTSGVNSIVVSAPVGLSSLIGTIFPIGFTTPGGAGDKWMSNNSEDPMSNEVSAPMPFAVELIAITYSSKISATRGNIQIHKAEFGSTSSNGVVFTWNMSTGRRIATRSDISGVTFNAGDKLGVFIEKTTGQEPDTPVIMLYFRITDDTAQELDENYGGFFN